MYCHNKRDGGGGEEGNAAAFGAAYWKGKDGDFASTSSLCVPIYFAALLPFGWLLHASEATQKKIKTQCSWYRLQYALQSCLREVLNYSDQFGSKNTTCVLVVLLGEGHPLISQERVGNPLAEKVFHVL